MGEARAGGASRALGHSVIRCKWGRDTHVCTFFQATGLFHWTALGSCCPRLGAEDPQAINPLYFRKITPPPILSKAPIHLLPLTSGTGSWPHSQEGGRRPAEGRGVCVGRGASCPVLGPWDSC